MNLVMCVQRPRLPSNTNLVYGEITITDVLLFILGLVALYFLPFSSTFLPSPITVVTMYSFI